MTIWAHTLVKNEARWLWYSISSVIEYVDKLLLWDTGSTDGTLDVIKELTDRYKDKISFKQYGEVNKNTFYKARQEMLDETKSDWFLMLDGDEIWWDDSIKKVVQEMSSKEKESIVVPTVNLVGDIFHYQEKQAGKYNLAGRTGHYNLRGINRNISGLKSSGAHGVWGWTDQQDQMIQDREQSKIQFVDAPYLHATNLRRSTKTSKDMEVMKREVKIKYDLGIPVSLDFYYPEVLFRKSPKDIESPWKVSDYVYKFRSFFETPLRKIKRRVFTGKVGY